jgi:hypothetical protein
MTMILPDPGDNGKTKVDPRNESMREFLTRTGQDEGLISLVDIIPPGKSRESKASDAEMTFTTSTGRIGMALANTRDAVLTFFSQVGERFRVGGEDFSNVVTGTADNIKEFVSSPFSVFGSLAKAIPWWVWLGLGLYFGLQLYVLVKRAAA